eukprot:TRINITY_DN11008_c0_g1_i1.p1 TRINITY_DN11008_c0_g1~~TRINITY_DN11008_c0_g1_i1.p1  ORF type:complete len:383 (-),score=80.26 TRINITY_DN11008_c0_g1_i1:435-1583(-)
MNIRFLLIISILFILHYICDESQFSLVGNFIDPIIPDNCINKQRINNFLDKNINRLNWRNENDLLFILLSDINEELEMFIESIEQYGEIPYLILFDSNKMKGRDELLKSFVLKYLKKKEEISNDLKLVVVDTRNVIMVGHPKKITKIYTKYYKDNVVLPAMGDKERDASIFITTKSKMVELYEKKQVIIHQTIEEKREGSLEKEKIEWDLQKLLFSTINSFNFDKNHKITKNNKGTYMFSLKETNSSIAYSYPIFLVSNEPKNKQNLRKIRNFFPPQRETEDQQTKFEKKQIFETKKLLLALFLDPNTPLPYLFLKTIDSLEFNKSNIVFYINYDESQNEKNNEYIENWISELEIKHEIYDQVILNYTDAREKGRAQWRERV